MAITLSGMASGLDTDSIISQLMAIEQNKVTAVQKRQVSVTQHKTDLTTIKTKLDAVKTAADRPDLRVAVEAGADHDAPSDTTKVDATVLGGAGIGGHSIQVNKLASSAQHGFSYTADATNAGKLASTTTATRTRPSITIDDRGQRHRDRHRDRRSTPTTRRPSTPPWSRTAASTASSSPRARPARTRTSTSTRRARRRRRR